MPLMPLMALRPYCTPALSSLSLLQQASCEGGVWGLIMHRLTARLLLIALLAGSYTPVALAFSATPPHACCFRKHSGSSPESSFDSRHYGEDCCRLLAANQWAQPRPSIFPSAAEYRDIAVLLSDRHPRTFEQRNSHAVRAPPVVSSPE